MKLIKTLFVIFNDLKIFFDLRTKFGRKRSLVAGVLVVVVVVGVRFVFVDNSGDEVAAPLSATVSVLSVSELGSKAIFDTVGKVEAVSEANLQTESGGRVLSVEVNVGDSVPAGKVLATIENAGQRATLLQAQGAYEAAVAASVQSGIGVDEAQTTLSSAKSNAVNTYRQSYNTVNSAIYNSIDTFFSSPESSLPGLRLGGQGNTASLNTERVAYQQILSQWQGRTNTISNESDLRTELAYARTQLDRTILFVDTFIGILNSSDDNAYSDAELQTYSTNFTTLRASLISTRSSVDSALSGLSGAEDGIRRAQLAASGGIVSASDAQVKMALGSLHAAQSEYQKTIVRTPIQGVVNAFYLKSGDYVSQGQPAGIVANNNGLQIKTFVTEIDSANLNVGDVVTIEAGASGVITAKAAALDPTNGKVAVVVGVNPDSGLTNGATVKLTFSQISTVAVTERILVPISALKITSVGSFVFTVDSDNKLVPVGVTQGKLFGENIEIVSGVTKETRIVTDARGLKAGQLVIVK